MLFGQFHQMGLKHFEFLRTATVVLLAALLYLQSIGFDFAYDDLWQIERDPVVSASAHSAESFSDPFVTATPPGDLYRPVTRLSYRITWMIWGDNPLPFHLTNLLLYTLMCLCALTLYRQIIPGENFAWIAALIFAAHPLHIEAVANVVGRAEILAALFSVAALLLFGRGRVILSAACLLLACLSKESALTTLFVLPLYARALGQQSAAGRYAPAVLAVASSLLIRYLVLGGGFSAAATLTDITPENPLATFSFSARLIPALVVLGAYIRLLILPWPLSADYSMMPADLMAHTYSLPGASNLALLIAYILLIWRFRRERWSFSGWWFLIAFALTANIFLPIGTIMGERLAFLPSLGFIAFCACLLQRMKLNPLWLSPVVLMFSLLTIQRMPVWRDNAALFAQSVSDAPRSPKALFNQGIELYQKHDLSGAEQLFRGVLELNPNYVPAMKCLADIFLARGELGKVEYWYRRILQINPQDAAVQEGLGRLEGLKAEKS